MTAGWVGLHLSARIETNYQGIDAQHSQFIACFEIEVRFVQDSIS
jgi:hypothetical protein